MAAFAEEGKRDDYALLDEVRTKLVARGGRTIRGLAREFKIMDEYDGNKKLDLQEFTQGLKDFGVELEGEEWKRTFALFDADGSGQVTMDEFLKAIRGSLNARRRDLVDAAYQIMDADGSGEVTIDDIKMAYRADEAEEVKSGAKTEEEIFAEFMGSFGDKDGDGKITKEEWYDYYAGVSSNMDTDDEFELMMRNAWHIAGGEGACANTSNVRVAVTHRDGSVTVECIEKDLGLDITDSRAVLSALRGQGIWDAVSYEASGSA